MTTMSRTLTITLILATALASLSACGKGRRSGGDTGAQDFSSGLADLEALDRERPGGAGADRTELSSAFEEQAAAIDSATNPDASGPPPQANLEPSLAIDDTTPTEGTLPAPRESNPAPIAESSDDAPRPETPDERRARLVAELAAAVRADPAIAADPVRREALLGALTLFSPAVTPDDRDLVDRERAVLEAWRGLFADVREGMQGSAGDLTAIPGAAARFSDRLASEQALVISEARLCARVEGFGRYTPLPTRLLAGRPHPAIVYTEVDHFGTRPGAGPDGEPGHTVALTQELALYHDADGLLAWRRPEQAVTDFSRNRRRDFFIVQRVDLPQTLTVGMYRLKVTVHDQTTGETTETIIPVEVVADASLIRESR
ncbi:MAG: hypothetical protein ACF8QF_02020 [Phycisphaerales bacterium]